MDNSPVQLYLHQQELLKINPSRHGIFHEAGSGKSITLLALAKKNNVRALIVCPKAIKTQWQEYVKEWGAGHVVVTKEEFKKFEAEKRLPPFEAVIIDETHHFSGVKSALYKQMKRYLIKNDVKYRWLASGTPYRSSPHNIFALGTLLGYNWNYYTFTNEYFYQVRMGPRMIPKVKPNIEEKLSLLVNTIGSTLRMDELVDVPEQTNITELFNPTVEQTVAILSLEEPMPITRFTKVHCIENGLLYSDGYTKDQVFKCEKNDRILKLCQETPKIAIFCRYTAQLEYLSTLLAPLNKPIFLISGSVKDRASVVKQVESSDECIVLIQAQCSEGYELPSIGTVIFASLSFSHVDHIQAKARFLRINKLKENTYYYLVTKGVDKDVYDCIMDKRDFHDAIYATEKYGML